MLFVADRRAGEFVVVQGNIPAGDTVGGGVFVGKIVRRVCNLSGKSVVEMFSLNLFVAASHVFSCQPSVLCSQNELSTFQPVDVH